MRVEDEGTRVKGERQRRRERKRGRDLEKVPERRGRKSTRDAKRR